ncbi:MAG: hypothetical protein CL528_13290 [Aequorivita sp.]|nr:hypothetical protein [Aequorivita sp.]|tara:strand:+ start:398 stop:2545 length:2148 start_codon:yes stop_codon:yes gene_type:complete
MVIKIPKIERQTVDLKPPRTNLLAATQDFVGPNIDKITALLERTAKEKHANDIRLENLRVNNKISKYESLLADQNEDLKKWVAEQENVLNEKELASKLIDIEKKQKLFLQGAYKNDSNFKNAFDGHATTALTNSKKVLNDENKARLFVEAQFSWSKFKTTQATEFTNIKSGFSMWAEFETKAMELDKKIQIAQKAGIDVNYDDEMATLRFEYAKKAVVGNNYRIDASGVQVVDNLAVLKALTDEGEPEFDTHEGEQISGKQTTWYGEELDDEMREKLIKHYDDESTKQHNKELKVNARQIDDNMKIVFEGIKNDTLTVDDINNMKWPDTTEGKDSKTSSIGYLVLKKSGMAETESKVNELIEIRKMIANNQILSTHQKFWLPDEVGAKAEELMKLHGWTDEGGSITDRMGVTIGISHEEMLKQHLTFDDVDRKNYTDFQRLVTSVSGRIKGVLSKHNLMSSFNLLKVELMIEKRFWDGIKDGKTAVELTNPNDPSFIFKDFEQYIPTLQEEAKQIAEIYTKSSADVNTVGEVTKVEVPDSYPKRNFNIYPNTEEGNEAWLNSEILQNWLLTDEGQNFLIKKDITPLEIMAEHFNKSKIKKMETATTSIEKDAIDLNIKYELVPPRPDGYKGKNWTNVYKKENPEAITLYELEKIVQKEKLKTRRKIKPQKRGTSISDGKDRIQKKILDGNPAYEEKDGIYYWKGTNIKVDVNQIK